MSRKLFIIALLLSLGALQPGRAIGVLPPIAPVTLDTYESHSRLSVKVHGGVDIEWKDLSGGFEVTLKGLTLVDLGAPFGQEREWVRRYSNISDQRISFLKFFDSQDGVRFVGRWRFPEGDQAPADPRMNAFYFRDLSRNRYVIDFWWKPGPTIKEARQRAFDEKRKNAFREIEKNLKNRVQRRQASIARNAELADTEKFCKEPLTEDSDIFLPFKPAHPRFDLSEIYPLSMPDNDYPYFEPEGEAQDARYVRLALDLYRKGQFGLSNRTIEFFQRDVRDKALLPQMKFLQANIFMKLGYEDKAIPLLKELMHESPKSGVALNSVIYLAGKAFEKEAYLESLEYFLWLLKNHSDHRLAWSFHFGLAESAYFLKQAERALDAYQWVIEKGPTQVIQASAAFRIGDVYLDRREYAEALAHYYRAVEKFPDQISAYPEILANRGEAFYWLGENERSSKEFHQLLKDHPVHPLTWRASFRLAEIEGRKNGRTPEYQRYLAQAINQNPYSDGAVLARIRMAPCGDHGGFNFQSAHRFFQEDASQLFESKNIDLRLYPDFKGLGEFRTYIRMKKPAEALEVASRLLKGKLESQTRNLISGAFNLVFRKYILALLDQGKTYQAISQYQSNAWALSDTAHPILYDYLLKLSQGASSLGFGRLAEKLNQKYEALTQDWKRRELASVEDLDIDLRQQQAEENFSVAQALWIAHGKSKLTTILNRLKLITGESPLAYDKEILLYQIKIQEGDHKAALMHLSKAKLLGKTQSIEENQRIDYALLTLQEKTDSPKIAEKLLQNLISAIQSQKKESSKQGSDHKQMTIEKDSHSDSHHPGKASVSSMSQLPAVPDLAELYFYRATLLEKSKHWSKAAESYKNAIEAGDSSTRVRFAMARALTKTKKAQSQSEAQKIFQELSENQSQDFWTKLAQEALETQKLNTDQNQGG
jgi:tetratricopeptide (TPR) repeat protein